MTNQVDIQINTMGTKSAGYFYFSFYYYCAPVCAWTLEDQPSDKIA